MGTDIIQNVMKYRPSRDGSADRKQKNAHKYQKGSHRLRAGIVVSSRQQGNMLGPQLLWSGRARKGGWGTLLHTDYGKQASGKGGHCST